MIGQMKKDKQYATNTVRLIAGRETSADLSDLARRCSALYNVGNYICRQRFLAEGQRVPGSNQLQAELKTHPIYRILPSDVAQEVLKDLAGSWKSYWALRALWKAGELKDKPGLPRYRKDRGTGEYREDWIPIKAPRSYSVDAHAMSMTLPKDLRARYKPNDGRLVVPYRGLRHHVGEHGKAEVLFDSAHGRWYFNWAVRRSPRQLRPATRSAAIDLGVRIVASLSVEGEHKAVHYSGRDVLKDYDYWGRQIAKHQRELAHRSRRSSRKLRQMHRKRRGRLEHVWEAISANIANRLVRQKVGVVYVGHPKGILRDRSYGPWAERIHNFWSFDLALRILDKHLRRRGILMERVNERGSSSTCTMDSNPADKTHKVVRRPRHLLSCRTCGHVVHSDQAGSRNILRFSKPSVRWDGLEASPRTETLRWNQHRWVDSANQGATRTLPKAA
jgi:putative transposase